MQAPPIRLTQWGLVNAYVVPEKDGVNVIDTGLPGLSPRLLALARRLRRPVRRILLTHAHDDHIGGVNALRAACPDAELLLGAPDAELLRERGVRAVPDRLLEGGDRVGPLRCISAAGHSAGQLAYLDERDGTLYAGDAFFNVPRLHAVSELNVLFALPTLATADPAQALRTARRLSELDLRWLAPGHGRPLADPQAAMRRAVTRAEEAPGPSAARLRLARGIGGLMMRRRD